MTGSLSPIPRWRDCPHRSDRPLEWWDGIYDHVFVALHPFVQLRGTHAEDLHTYITTRKAKRPDTWADIAQQAGLDPESADPDLIVAGMGHLVGWRDIHEMVGNGEFLHFARHIFKIVTFGGAGFWKNYDQAFGDFLKSELKRLRLVEPADGSLSAGLMPRYAEFLRRCGVERFTLIGEVDEAPDMTPDQLSKAPYAHLLNASVFNCIYEEGRSIFICCAWGTMDWTETLIAMTAEARDLARPEELFEGFYLKPEDRVDWLGLIDDGCPTRG